MDVRSPLYQNIALIVAGVLFLNPIVATAAQLAVDRAAAGNTAVTQAQNGVPMVNIATPNGSGLSHNKFTDYNVGQQGLILNNSAQNVVQTQLGGYVVGNPNLKNGAAGLILNEVTGGNASQLRGYTEVAGRSAAVIVANPHGITCDGCGFINTPRVTLSTGSPVVEDGRLQRFDVDGGQISIEGAGLNAGNVDQFDLITRSAQINAELHAKKLNIITGRNDVDATTLAATAKADDGSDKPMLAIDSSALGGMYAGAIRLVGTEQGVGVKLAGDMAASAGDIQIDANGKLSLARVATSNDLKLAAEEIELGADTYAGRNAVVSATGKTQVKDSLAAGNRVEIGGGELDNQGVVEAGVKADGTLVSDSALVLNSRSVTNRGELIARGNFEADVEVLDNSSGKLLSAGNANIQAAQLSNSQGQVIAQRNLELGGGALSNQDGEVLAAGELHVDAASLDNQSGTVAANAIDLKLSGALSNAQGLIESSQALALAVDSVQNRDGRLRALASSDKSAFQVGNLFDNDQGLVEIGNAAFALASGSLSNQGGTMRHLGSQGFELNLADLGNAGGRFSTNGELSLSADDWNNTSELQAERLTLNIGQFTQTATGQLISRQSITANGDNWVNDGVIATDGSLDLTLTGRYEGNGALRSLGDLTFKAASAEFGSDAEAKSGGAARFELSGQLLSRGRLTAAQDMSLALGSLDNRGTLGGAGLLRIEADSLRNEQGLVFSGADMTLRAGSLTNYKGDIYSLGALSVAKDDSVGQLATLENISGTIESAGSMQLAAASLINRKDVFAATASQLSGHMTLTGTDNCKGQHCEASYVVTEVFGLQVTQDSARANLIAGGDLNFIGGSFDNRFSTVSSGGDIKLDTLNFRSTGAAGGETRYYDYYVYTKSRPDYYGLLTNIDSYNAYHDPSSASYNPAAMPLSSFAIGSIRHSNIVKTSGGGETVNSVIQAVGKVDITGTQALENSLVRPGEQIDQSPSRVGQTTVSSDVRPAATLNAQLPPDLQQQAVDPLAQPSFTLPQGQNGLFRVTTTPGNRYLVETDPAFADLRNFLNSDYLLSRLGFDPDQVQKRLGDGLYEQRLIRDAVVARTGQRLIAGLDSDEAMYRYLMDNAVASKEALNLVPGVALTAEQVAALTHDIVWMQEQEVHGEKVLVPVLYFAQASGRLAPTGALIQGSEVSLISGGDLANKGTLRASGDFNAVAKNIGNQGLIQADNRLALLATDSIRNAQGGIINGRDVSLTAISGDITNERSIGYTEQSGRFTFSHASVDSAARIEASNNLVMDAGRDLNNLGSVLKAGGDATLSAKRDLTLGVVTEVDSYNSQYRKLKVNGSQTTQHGSDVQVGGDVEVSAGRNVAVVGSRVRAGSDVTMEADGDLLISSAANESHLFSRSKKVTESRDQIIQQSSDIQAGNDISLVAGKNLAVVASGIKAGNDVDMDAEEDVQILSAKDESASYYFKKKKGSFGRSSTKQQESYHSTNIASVIEAGNDLTINTSKTEGGGLSIDGGRDVTVIGSQLNAGSDLLVGATGDVAILSGVEEHGSYSKKTKSGFLGMSKSGKSQLKTSATQVASELEAGNDVVIAAGNDIRLRASTTEAGNDVELRAGLVNDTGDINLVSANDEAYSRSESYKKKFGLSASDAAGLAVGTPSWGGDIAISSAKKSGQEIIRSTNVGSQVNAVRDASLIAERDINVVGSGVSAGRNVLLDAGRDVNVVAGSSSEQVASWKNTKTVGLQQDFDRNGFSTFVGEEKLKDKLINSQQTAAGSQINAGLDIDVRVGRDIVQQGSDLTAGYDLNLQAGRNILIDAAAEQSLSIREQSQKRTGTTTTVNHNFGNTMDALSGAGKGDNSVSQASSILKAADGVTQFLSGPTFDAHIGSTGQSQRVTQVVQGNRASTLTAGNDVNLQAQNDVTVRGGQFSAGRDINVAAQDVTFDVARGEQRFDNQQSQSKGGVVGGTTGGFKVGIGGSSGTATQQGSQGTSSGAQLNAQRDINLSAERDLSLIGTQVQAGRDIDLHAGNDLAIGAAANAHTNEDRRRSGGGEVGLTFGSDGIGVYASVNIGRGSLDREGARQQEAYLYAGRDLSFESGRDTTVSGAKLEGENVTGEVGRNLIVSSVPDTGKVSGKEFDLSATVTIGYGASVSGSVGYGETTGKTHWVGNQTAITARDRLDIRTEEHTQIDGAVLASQTGNLKLDTDTLGFRDIKGEDKERSYYLNAGGSYGSGQQDQSQQGKGETGVNGWSLSGYEYEKEREQIVRATVGAGEIVVRSDAENAQDSTAGLNRDTSQAYEITKDKEERTDLYVSKASIEALSDPEVTVKQWANALATYDETVKANFKDVSILVNASLNEWERLTGRLLPEGASEAGGQEIAEQALYGLIMSGMSRADAQALLANEAFQNRVLAELRDISQVFSDDPGLLRETEQELAAAGVDVSPDALQLSPTEVVGKKVDLRTEQEILDRVSAVNAYIEDNPEKAEAVGFVMAAAQGPKGLIMWAAEQALSETPFGEKVAQYQAYLQGVLGKAVAEGVEQRDDMDEQDGGDAYLIGGGSLIATLLVGAAGSKTVKVIKTKENTSPAKNHNPDSAQTDMEAGYPLPDRPVKDASKDPSKVVPKMDEFTVKAFNPYSSDKFKAMSPEQQKAFIKEYNKQLQSQQDAINRMTVDEFKSARDAYEKVGRNPDAVAAQQKFGKDFENSVRESITESLMAKGKDFKTASAEAAVRAKEIRTDLAALHDPDMVAGGWLSPEPVRMGDPLVNSSIGGGWPSRLKALDEQVSNAIANGSGQAQMNIRLELLRGAEK